MKIANKIFAITFLISSVAITGISVVTIMSATDSLRDLSKKRLFDNVSREAKTIQNSIEMVKSDISMLGGRGALGALVEASESLSRDSLQMMGDQLNAIMRRRGVYRQIQVILAPSGWHHVVRSMRIGDAVRASIDPPVLHPAFEDVLRAPQGLRSEEVLLGVPRQELQGDKPRPGQVLYYSFPVTANNSAIVGAIEVVVDFDELVRGMGSPNDGIDYFVTDMNGRYLFSSMQEPSTTNRSRASNIIDDYKMHGQWTTWLSQEENHLQAESRDLGVAVNFHRIDLVGEKSSLNKQVLIVGGAISLAEVEKNIGRFRSLLVTISLGVGALMALALALATKYLTRPIIDLTNAANRIAGGDRTVQAPSDQRDEIGALARAVMRMAQALRDTAKNEEQATMGRMASMIAHDLRNALSSVKMNLKILHSHHQDSGDEYCDGCEIALDQVRYMENILNDILAFTRLGGLDCDWVDLGDTIRTATVSLLPEITRKKIRIDETSGHNLPTAMGDRNKLLQVFQNLLDNAVQAAPEEGQVSIEVRPILYNSRPSVEVRIADNGDGIPSELVEKAFEPFFTTRARGTGLGLAIAHKIVKQHGGEISLSRRESGGTVATVILPLTPEDWGQESRPGAQ